MSLLWLKLTLAPALVVAVSLAARVFGPTVGGLLAGLPIVAAPVLLFLALEQGAAFGAHAAYGCALGVLSLVLFCFTFAQAGRRFGWPVCVLLGWAVVAASTAVMRFVPQTFWTALLVPGAAVTLALVVLPRPPAGPAALSPPRWDVPLRIAATASMVLAITWLADRLGPSLSGLLSPFPIATTVLAAFAHAQLGHAGSARLLRGLVLGLYSFVLFAVSLGFLLPRMRLAAAFGIAIAATLTLHAGLGLWVRWRSLRVSPSRTRSS